MHIRSKRVIGIDCGTAIVGWSVMEKSGNSFELIDSGAILTKAGVPMEQRLAKIYNELIELIEKYSPDEMAVESVFYFKNKTTVISVSQARGVIILTAGQKGISVYDYTPLQVKTAVTGYGRAEKKQIQFMLTKILKMKEVPKLDDITDAIAVSICHFNNHPK